MIVINVIELRPNDAGVYTRARNYAKSQLERYAEAIADLKEAIRINPDAAVFYQNRRAIKSLLRNFEDAISDYVEAIRINPDAELKRTLCLKSTKTPSLIITKQFG